jgi:large subunit ribosomal protein L10
MVSEKKKKLVQELAHEITKSPLVGLANLEYLPAPQLQRMKAMLRNQNVHLAMTRKRLLRLALEQSGRDNIQLLIEKMKGMPALILSHGNPFALYSLIKKNRSEAPAKAGQIAPYDLVVRAGPTSFAPGPIISEFAAVGIKTKVDGGKLTIIQDTVIVREGQPINQKAADTLKRMDIKPMEIGLTVVAVWENGLVFDSQQLDIDEKVYQQNIQQGVQWGLNLALEIAYPCTDTIELLLQKAFHDAKSVALEQHILTDATAEEIITAIEREVLALKEAAGIEVPEKPESAHPNLGRVTLDEAAELVEKLKKEGTLREEKHDDKPGTKILF